MNETLSDKQTDLGRTLEAHGKRFTALGRHFKEVLTNQTDIILKLKSMDKSYDRLNIFLASKAVSGLDVRKYIPFRTDDELMGYFEGTDNNLSDFTREEREEALTNYVLGSVTVTSSFPTSCLRRLLSEWFLRLHYWPSVG